MTLKKQNNVKPTFLYGRLDGYGITGKPKLCFYGLQMDLKIDTQHQVPTPVETVGGMGVEIFHHITIRLTLALTKADTERGIIAGLTIAFIAIIANRNFSVSAKTPVFVMDWRRLHMTDTALNRIKALPLWKGEISATPLGGGITNVNYVVTDGAAKYVARLGEDIPQHHVMRFNERAASRAAHAAGLSPAVVYAETGVTVLEFIECHTYSPKDVHKNLARILPLIRKCHVEIPKHLHGPALIFWVFHVVRDYAASLQDADSAHQKLLPELVEISNALEAAAGPFDMVYGHNDLLAANFLDDGKRLWLIDWDYAGFNSPLFDLGGLASNNELTEAQEIWLLENYFEAPVSSELLHRYTAMKCASLLRETMWSMVSEVSSDIDFDYATYTTENLARFRVAYNDYIQT